MNKKYNRNTYKFVRFTGKIVRNKTQKNPLESLGKIPALTNEIVKNEIDLYQKSLNDSKGIEMREMSKEEM